LIVNDKPMKQRILSALSDECSIQILSATAEETLSALELSKNCEIPLAKIYYRIAELVDAGLLAVAKYGRTPDGKWYELYASAVIRIEVNFDRVGLRMNVELSHRCSDEFTRMWTSACIPHCRPNFTREPIPVIEKRLAGFI